MDRRHRLMVTLRKSSNWYVSMPTISHSYSSCFLRRNFKGLETSSAYSSFAVPVDATTLQTRQYSVKALYHGLLRNYSSLRRGSYTKNYLRSISGIDNRFEEDDIAEVNTKTWLLPDDTVARALSSKHDEEWDSCVATSIDGGCRVLELKDSHEGHRYNFYPEIEETHEPGFEMKYTHSVEIGWDELKHKVDATQELLNATTWTTEQWFTAETLSTSIWSTQHTIRAVVLQFLLYHRALVEKGSILNSGKWHSQQLVKWLDLPLVNSMLSNWRLVYKSGMTQLLRDCSLSPDKVFTIAVMIFHDRFESMLSEWSFYLILDADVEKWRPETPHFAQKILDTSLDLYQTGDKRCKPKPQLFNSILQAWMHADSGQAAVVAVREVFNCMSEHDIHPNGRTYKFALRIWGQQQTSDVGVEAEKLLQRMYAEYLAGADATMPDVHAFALVVAAWSKSGSPDAGPRGEQIYRQMLLLRKQKHLFGTGDIAVINTVLQGYTLSLAPEAPVLSEKFWRSTGQAGGQMTYSILIKHYAQNGQVEDVKRLLAESRETGNQQTDTSTYTLVFQSYAESKLSNKVALASDLLHHLEQDPKIKLTTFVYNAFLCVLARDTRNHNYSELSERTLLKMIESSKHDPNVKPDAVTFSTVMDAWARAARPDRAVAVLTAMYDDYLAGNEKAKPDRQAFNTVLKAYTRSSDENVPHQAESFLRQMHYIAKQGDLDIYPDTFTYASVMSCIAKCKDRKIRQVASQKVEDILHHMKHEYETNKTRVRPNVYCYNNAIDAWARVGDAQRAETIFLEMCDDYKNGNESAKPQTATFNILMKAWAFSKKPEASVRAEEILEQMHEVTQSGAMHVPPDIKTYSSLVLCLGLSKKSGSPQRAEALVRKIDQLHRSGELKEGPNKIVFVNLLKAWKFSNEPEKNEKVEAIKLEIKKRFGFNHEF